MNKKEAIKLMLEGKKVRRKPWHHGSYLFMDARGTIVNGYKEYYNINKSSDLSWELYKEPKKKKRVIFYEYTSSNHDGTLVLKWSSHSKEVLEASENATLTGNTREIEIED